MKTYPLHIHIAQPTDTYNEIKSPFTGEIIARVEKANTTSLALALLNAERSFQKTMRKMPAYQRADILYKVADLIRKNHEDLSIIIASEGGKPLKDARAEVTRAINTTKMSGDETLQLNGEQISMDRSSGTEKHLAFTIREPVGPVLAISAFNHPVNLICHQVCTAIAAGNSVIVKPASQTPISALKICGYFREAGLPDGVINVATCSGSETNQLIESSTIRFITFIGGADVGFSLLKKIQPGVRVALEHGGTGTAILDEKADIEYAIPNIVRAAFYHAGQVCVSSQILYIHESIYDKVLPTLITKTKALNVGNPTSDQTDVGPLISSRDVSRIQQWVQEAISQGANVLCGGELLNNNCYAPTLLENVSDSMKVIKEEIFGPVLCVRKYKRIESVIQKINSTPYAFQNAIYTQDIDLAISTAREIETKACMINESSAFRVDWMPFGGKKTSGLGVGGVKPSILDMTEEKLIVMNIRS